MSARLPCEAGENHYKKDGPENSHRVWYNLTLSNVTPGLSSNKVPIHIAQDWITPWFMCLLFP